MSESTTMGRFIAAAVISVGVIAWGAAAVAAEMLSGDEIKATVAGKTIAGTMEGSGAYAEFYAADGTIRGKDYTGAWTVEGDAMCFQYGADPKTCWQVGRDGGAVQWVKDGKVEGTGTVTDGNTNNF